MKAKVTEAQNTVYITIMRIIIINVLDYKL